MPRIPLQELYQELHRVLIKHRFPEERAAVVARLFSENQRDGVYSHGLNRFGGFLSAVRNQQIDIRADPVRVGGLEALEQWDGRMGIGLWNARVAMARAIEIARQHGLGCVGLRNTNHWMRAGAYGLQAAEAGCVGICWTNTIPLMPPWGSAEVKIGNNPLVIALPRPDGPVLLDMAISQFSNGKLEVLKKQGKQLPLAGGYGAEGNLTRDPAAILASRRPLPIGYWKGSALAVILDLVAALLSGGKTSREIGRQGAEYGVSQVFIAIDVTALNDQNPWSDALEAALSDLHSAAPLAADQAVRYPGEQMLLLRRESLAKGVLVDEADWAALRAS